MTLSSRQSWEQKTHLILDQYERGTRRMKLTRSGLADLVGVSRQTLWRNASIRARVNQLLGTVSPPPGVGAKRLTLAARVRDLKRRVDGLEAENSILTQNFIVLCRALDERGLDPVDLLGLTAADLTCAKIAAAWR